MSTALEKECIEARGPTNDKDAPSPPAVSRSLLRRYQTGYFLSAFAFGPPFASFVTFVGFQLQRIGYVIGHAPGEAHRSGCYSGVTSCRVPFAGSGDVNLTSYILYLNAITYAVSGALTLVVSGIGDYVNHQREQYIVQLILYGVLALPVASLRGRDLTTFNVLSGLYVVFNVVGFLAGAWMNIFIPFVMHISEDLESPSAQDVGNNQDVSSKAIENGMRMGVWGSNGLSAGQIILFVAVIGLTFVSTVYAGLYTITASGALCIILSLVAWRMLPTPKPKNIQGRKKVREWLVLPLSTFSLLFRQIWEYPESFKFLLAFTVYNDTQFAFSSITNQLFNLNIRPKVLEFTYYSLVQPATSIVSATAFLYLRPIAKARLGLTLRHWMMISYLLTCFCTVWCAIGISPSATIGFKQRWEFYFFQALQSMASSIASVAFKVLFSRLFPQGKEIQYFGFQLVLSLLTVWIPQIVNGPIIDATNNLRFPAAISAGLLLFCVVVTMFVDEKKGMRQAGYESTGD